VDKKGKEVVKPKYTFATPFVDGSRAFPFSEGISSMSVSALQHDYDRIRYHLINTEGSKVSPTRFASVKPFSEGLAAVKLKGKYGFINKKG
jgi:hypothetical protein